MMVKFNTEAISLNQNLAEIKSVLSRKEYFNSQRYKDTFLKDLTAHQLCFLKSPDRFLMIYGPIPYLSIYNELSARLQGPGFEKHHQLAKKASMEIQKDRELKMKELQQSKPLVYKNPQNNYVQRPNKQIHIYLNESQNNILQFFMNLKEKYGADTVFIFSNSKNLEAKEAPIEGILLFPENTNINALLENIKREKSIRNVSVP